MIRFLARLFTFFWLIPLPDSLANARLPDGGIAEMNGQGVVRAWYGRPTDRYAHGVLGDAIEAGSLLIVDEKGRQRELVLPATQVFEDITPRIADLDGDGRNEIIAIRSGLATGASVVVYHVADGHIVERAATPALGRPNRWLSIAAIEDFLGVGSRQIAIVKTPHIGGVLEILALKADRLVSLYPPKSAFSTHVIGSRTLSMAAAADMDGDGAAELALPDQSRRRLIVLSFGTAIRVVLRADLPARIDSAVRIVDRRKIIVPLETGETLTVHAP